MSNLKDSKNYPPVPLNVVVETAINKSVIHFATSIYAGYTTRENLEKIYYACRDSRGGGSLVDKCPELNFLLNPKLQDGEYVQKEKQKIHLFEEKKLQPVKSVIEQKETNTPIQNIQIFENGVKVKVPDVHGSDWEAPKVENEEEIKTATPYTMDEVFTKIIPELSKKGLRIQYLHYVTGMSFIDISKEGMEKGYLTKSDTPYELRYQLKIKGLLHEEQ